MKEEDKNIEALIDKVMQHHKTERLPMDFTSKLMQKISEIETKQEFVYKPLISRTSWFLLASSIIILISSYFLTNEFKYNENSYLTNLKLAIDNYFNFTEYTFEFSKISLLAILFSGIMIFFQFIYLKNHFDNQFEK